MRHHLMLLLLLRMRMGRPASVSSVSASAGVGEVCRPRSWMRQTRPGCRASCTRPCPGRRSGCVAFHTSLAALDVSLNIAFKAAPPFLVCMSNSASVASSASLMVHRRSPRVSAPSIFMRRAIVEVNLISPPISVTTRWNSGLCSWLDRWHRPNCCTALSADQGSSNVYMTRGRLLPARLSACSEIPALAASVMIAMRFSPSWNNCRSLLLMDSPCLLDWPRLYFPLSTYSRRPVLGLTS
mmetsp:Transcript_28531/g.82262  ORF Transcript_28531/g.82262 Transcript_28531/m.82262 type:complete len:240 (-) Transcript_28531:553-1272(-)